MFSTADFAQAIFHNNAEFDHLAYQLYEYQHTHNELYNAYAKATVPGGRQIRSLRDIPFLPISFFKTHEVRTGAFTPDIIFESSGTTGAAQSRHYVKDKGLYEESFRGAFELFYGPVEDMVVIGLLPSYLERKHSSLVYMVDDLIRLSGKPESGFYLYELEKLHRQLQALEKSGKKVLLIGVTFALLDFAEKYEMHLQQTIVMETGGMKGRREEMTRGEVHAFLKARLGIQQVHSEYGMSELLSQAYSPGKGILSCPPWMKVVLRDETDPLQVLPMPEPREVQQGIINVIDLANIHSCAFIATDDIGKLYSTGEFEVLGRMDNSDVRGCNQLVL